MKENIQLNAVGAHKALGEFVYHAAFGVGTALDKKSAAAGFAAQHFGFLAAHDNGLIGVNGVGGDNANFIKQAIEAMGLKKLLGKLGVYVLGIEAGFQNQRLAIHMANTHEAVNLGVGSAELQHLHDVGSGLNNLKLNKSGGGGHAHGADFAGEGINHFGFAAHLGLGHEGTSSLLADNQTFAFKSAYGLTDGGAGYIKGFAKLGLAGQKVARCKSSGGNITFNNTHQLGVKRNIAIHGKRAEKNRVFFHCGFLPGTTASRVFKGACRSAKCAYFLNDYTTAMLILQ